MVDNAQSAKAIARQRLWFWHWMMAACFLLLFVVGIYMADLPRGTPQRPFLLNLHKSFGVLVIGLLLIRLGLVWRVRSLQKGKSLQQNSSRTWVAILHTTLYGFMLGVPLSGYAYSSWAGSHVPLFGLEMPLLVTPNEARVDLGRTVHFYLAYSFLSLVIAHIVAQRKFLKGFWLRTVKQLQKQNDLK